MVSRPGEMPALESGAPEGLMGGMSLPIGMTRRALSYDDALEAPMSPLPSDINVNILWKKPVIPERRFQRVAEEEEPERVLTHAASFDPETIRPPVPVVRTKASSVIMNTLMTKHSQESMQRFEQQAGLTDAGYTPHKGLAAEEARYHRMAESLHKMRVQSGEKPEEKQSSSAQSSPSTTPQGSPKQRRRGWFSQGSVAPLPGLEIGPAPAPPLAGEPAASAGGGGAMERWSAFGPRPTVQKSNTDPGGFALQAYKGAQKPSPMEVMKAQGTRLAPAEESANLRAPRMEIPVTESKRHSPRHHKLKPRDMNVLTPSGF